MDIVQLAKEIHKTSKEKGWWDKERNFGELIALLHSEVSEAFEEWRSGHDFNEIYFNNGKPEGVSIELADVAIRLLDMCEKYNIDLIESMLIKMEYNKTRSHRHGGKRA